MSARVTGVEGMTSAQLRVLRQTHNGIWQRCTNPRLKRYPNYGGRGISVAECWREFKNFAADMGPRPSRFHSIDRIDNDGNYEPGNCRWATREEQFANRTNCTYVLLNGKAVTIRAYTRYQRVTTTQVMQMISAGLLAEVCPKGHVFTADNVYRYKRDGKISERSCRTCRYLANRRAVAKLQAKAGGKKRERPMPLPPHLARNLRRTTTVDAHVSDDEVTRG
jgi:hypothetical protein